MQVSKKHLVFLKPLKTILNLKWLIWCFFIGLAFSNMHCASIQRPMGGPKDSIPPEIIEELPKNLTRNFKAKEIAITFNEYIKLQNEMKEISVTPDMDQPPLYKIKKRTLIITLPDSLEEKTTYTINFGKAIGDYNEGNPLLNYSYVFATGDELDSLNVSGTVTNALTKEKEKDVSVILIPTRLDSIFGKRKANIFTLSDSSGNFTIKNLKEDDYRIYAIKEQNGDRIYNAADEQIAFLVDSFHLQRDTSDIQLQISKGIPRDFRLLDRKIQKDARISFLFNRPLKNPDIHVLVPQELNADKIIHYSTAKDSANMWLSSMTFDSLSVSIIENGIPLDTTTIRRNKNEKYDRDMIITDNLNSRKVDRINHIQLFSTAPIKKANKTNIVLLEDSVNRTNYQLIADTGDNKRYYLRFNWRPKRNYELELKESAFEGYFGEKSKSVKRSFTLDEVENFGDINLQINIADSVKRHYLVQITNEKKETLIKSTPIDSSQHISYKQLPGGKYLVRIVYDKNGNNQWDPGDVYKRIQPEPIWYHDKTITIRPNWEQEEIVNVPKIED